MTPAINEAIAAGIPVVCALTMTPPYASAMRFLERSRNHANAGH